MNPVPVFPLPNVVLFPRTILPLHVFEPRYRALVRDAAAGEGLIAVSLLFPGWESDYEGSPAFHPVGTVGRIENLQPLPDGRFMLQLVGFERVEFGEVVREEPYRLVRVRSLPEAAAPQTPEAQAAKLELLTSQSCLQRALSDEPAGAILLDESVPFESATNGACANLPVQPAVRQSLLVENDLLRRCRRATELADAVLQQVLRQPDPEDPRPLLN